jgi:hypothetical protein
MYLFYLTLLMKYIFLLLVSFAILFACNTGNNSNGGFMNSLEATQYVINTDRDTTIETKNGALLKIPGGALAAEDGNTVTLEIKEAYSLAQMIQGGLTTQSGDDPLSSGGMIYINAAPGQKVTLQKNIQVAIPADFLQAGMQLYKGQTGENGTINWVDPKPLSENKQLTPIERGKTLFENRCASCHTIGQDMTGPNLAHFMKRFPVSVEGNYRYYNHAGFEFRKVMVSKEPPISFAQHIEDDLVGYNDSYREYKCNLHNMYGSVGPPLVTDSAGNLMDIYRYIQNESDRRNLPMPSHAYLEDCIDSCKNYKNVITKLQNEKQKGIAKRKNLIKDNGPLVDQKPDSTWPTAPVQSLPPDFGEKVSPENYDAVYYQFTMDSFGWHNIDMLMKNTDGIKESELFVQVTGQYQEKIKTYLIIPSVKTYGEGGPAGMDNKKFAFFYKNGKIPLPQGAKAFILAVTETEGSIAFGLQEFIITTQQEVSVELHAASKEEFTAAMQQFETQRLHIKVGDSKNAGEIRKIDAEQKNIDAKIKEAENLRPKRCDCNCGSPGIDTTSPAESTDYMISLN